MPIFEYHCDACDAEFEKIVNRAQADNVACDACGSDRTQRLLSAFGVGASSSGNAPACDLGECASGACDLGGGMSPCAGGMCPGMLN